MGRRSDSDLDAGLDGTQVMLPVDDLRTTGKGERPPKAAKEPQPGKDAKPGKEPKAAKPGKPPKPGKPAKMPKAQKKALKAARRHPGPISLWRFPIAVTAGVVLSVPSLLSADAAELGSGRFDGVIARGVGFGLLVWIATGVVDRILRVAHEHADAAAAAADDTSDT